METRFNVGINPLWPGEKLHPGDYRWGDHTASFHAEQHDLDSFVGRVTSDGYAFSAVMQGGYRSKDNFISAQHLALDDDRGIYESSIKALAQNLFIAKYAAFLYETPTSTQQQPKSRVVFLLGAPITDLKQYERAQQALLSKFRETDESVKDASRFFYGRINAPHKVLGNVLPQHVLEREVIEPFIKAKGGNTGHRFIEVTNDFIPEKHRNTTLTSLAGTMRRRGMSRSAIEVALLAENQSRCDPPLTENEVRRIAASVSSYNPGMSSPSDGKLPELQVIPLSEVESKTVRWLWMKRIPLGKQTVLGGDPGLGKSYLALDLAARGSHGGPLPPWDEGGRESENAPKGDVLIISAEDGLEDTIKPRLERLGAEMSRIHAISPLVRHGDKEVSLSLSDHLLQLEQAIVEHDAILMILDPVLAFTGKGDSHKSSDMRAVLGPLATIAERTGCAILSIIHLNKRSTEQKTIYRLMASLDIVASARSVMAVGADPNDPDKRVLAPVKMNLSTKPPSLGFHINEEHGFVWGGIVELDADTIIGAPTSIDDRSALDEGIDVLTEILSSGPLPAETVKQEAKEAGISDPTLRRAKASLGVKAVRVTEGNKGGGYWAWELPSQHDQEPRVQNDERLTEFDHLTDSQAQTEDLTEPQVRKALNPHTQGKMVILQDEGLPWDHNEGLEEGRL